MMSGAELRRLRLKIIVAMLNKDVKLWEQVKAYMK